MFLQPEYKHITLITRDHQMTKNQLITKVQKKTDKDIIIFDPIGLPKLNFFLNQMKILLTKTNYLTIIVVKND
tara:strand:+ start:516 stop:734 length:219 start_codon:yes stop_codon:yes gene_type:complete